MKKCGGEIKQEKENETGKKRLKLDGNLIVDYDLMLKIWSLCNCYIYVCTLLMYGSKYLTGKLGLESIGYGFLITQVVFELVPYIGGVVCLVHSKA